eukprot:2754807-Amphidinium_carterae.1
MSSGASDKSKTKIRYSCEHMAADLINTAPDTTSGAALVQSVPAPLDPLGCKPHTVKLQLSSRVGRAEGRLEWDVKHPCCCEITNLHNALQVSALQVPVHDALMMKMRKPPTKVSVACAVRVEGDTKMGLKLSHQLSVPSCSVC